MSDDVTAVVITAAIFGVFFAWVPFLNLICPPCGRFLERRRNRENATRQMTAQGAIRSAER